MAFLLNDLNSLIYLNFKKKGGEVLNHEEIKGLKKVLLCGTWRLLGVLWVLFLQKGKEYKHFFPSVEFLRIFNQILIHNQLLNYDLLPGVNSYNVVSFGNIFG